MPRFVSVAIITFLFLGLVRSQCFASPTLTNQMTEHLRNRVETAGTCPVLSVEDQICHASVVLPRFYERRLYRPAWCTGDGPSSRIDDLLRAIRNADKEGLTPTDYHLARIESMLAKARLTRNGPMGIDPGFLADLDFLISDAFLVYAGHLLAGRVDPLTIQSTWLADRRQADLAKVLSEALETGRVEEALQGLLPAHQGYVSLRKELVRYRTIAAQGGWPVIAPGPAMKNGVRGNQVSSLRARLLAEGDLDPRFNTGEEVFDHVLEEAVRTFQRRHGLETDGVVGPKTLAELNVSAESRVRQIEANMERWRWLPHDLGTLHILVNIADFHMDVVENGSTIMNKRVVVGKPYWKTPVFSAKMTYLVFSPYWNVPPGIARKETFPKVKRDLAYLEKENFKIISGWGAKAREIDPATINWAAVTAKTFPYRFRQEPGPDNALGRVKFMFPNKFNVYLHDTPARQLFKHTERGFSHGCIRLEKPLDLAAYLLHQNPRWTREAMLAAIDKKAEQTVPLPKPINVHVLYWTAWVDENGTVQFRKDIYGRDRALERALGEKPPALDRASTS